MKLLNKYQFLLIIAILLLLSLLNSKMTDASIICGVCDYTNKKCKDKRIYYNCIAECALCITNGCESDVDCCVSNCINKECGDDGCGGTCGVCGEGKTCEDGKCVCKPNCTNKKCGDSDGCGGTCYGPCLGGGSCQKVSGSYSCVSTCEGVCCDSVYVCPYGLATGSCVNNKKCCEGSCGCIRGTKENCTTSEGCPGERVCGSTGLFGPCNKLPDCECAPNGSSKDCTTSDGCPGKQYCNNGKWGDCQKNDPSCECGPDGTTQSCTTSDGCAGTKTCSNGKWGDCKKNDPNCGTSPPNQSPCSEGSSKDCTTSDGCPGKQYCNNGKWGDCQKNDPSCECGPNGISRECTINNCPGTQTCNESKWGDCIKNNPNCGVTCQPGSKRSCYDDNGCIGEQECLTTGEWGACHKSNSDCAKGCINKNGKCCQKAASEYAYQSLDCPEGYYCLTSGECPPLQMCHTNVCNDQKKCKASTFSWPKNFRCPSCSSDSDCEKKSCQPMTCINKECKKSNYQIYIDSNKNCSDFDVCTTHSECESVKKCTVGQCSQIQVPDKNDPTKKQWVPICTLYELEIPSNKICPSSSCSRNSDCGGGGDDGEGGDERDKYSCNTSTGICYVSNNGSYSSSSSCENQCKFKCNTTNWTCEFDPNGAFVDKNSCQSQCNSNNLIINLFADPKQITQGIKTLLKVTYEVTNAKPNSQCRGNSTDNFFWRDYKINIGDSGNKNGNDLKEVTLNEIKNYDIWLTCIDKNNNPKTATTTVGVISPPTTQPPTSTTQPPPPPPPPPKDCRILEFSINGKTNKDQNPLIFWVNQTLTGKVSTNFDCVRCEVSSNDNWNETYTTSNNWDFGTSRTATTQFKISRAGDYSFTLTCYGEDPNDIDTDTLSLHNVKVYKLPFWHEIIPVLPGFLRGLFGVR